MARHSDFKGWERGIIVVALAGIGLATFGIGLAWRNSGDQPLGANAPRSTGVAQVVTQQPTSTPTLPPTKPPVATPSPVSTPTVTLTDTATESPTLTAIPPTETPTEIPPTATPQAVADVGQLGTPMETTMPGSAIGGPTATPPTTSIPDLTLGAPTPILISSTNVTGEVIPVAGLTLRSGPAKSAQALAVYLSGVVLQIVARSDDQLWARVRYQGQEGWVALEFLKINGDINSVPLQSQLELAGVPSGQRCVSTVGDSLAYGEVLFELPAVGFIKVAMNPFSSFLSDQFVQRGIRDMPVTNRSWPGVGISSPNHTLYYSLPVFNDLLRDRCEFTVVLPWVNDLSNGREPDVASADHAEKLADLARQLVANNPRGHIILINYYSGAPAPFSEKMAFGFTPNAISAFNSQMMQSCKAGALSQIPQVICVDTTPVFQNVGTAYVVGSLMRPELEALMIKPLTEDEAKMLDYYTRTAPNQPMTGDGIHLSALGKTVLAAYVVDLMLSIPK